MSDLGTLREELDVLDRELLALAKRRLDVVKNIGQLKHSSDSPLFHRERERDVYARARAMAKELELPPTVAESLVQVLVDASHDAQQMIGGAVCAEADCLSFLLVGGHGAMGRWFSALLSARGHRVDCWEPGDPRTPARAAAGVHVVLLCVSMHAAVEVARQWAPHVPESAVLCDINSLKEEICAVYESDAQCECVGLHPMFGPTVMGLRRQKVVVCEVRPGPGTERLLAELGRMGAELVHATPVEHDRMMAIVQVLVHYRTLAMGEALRRAGVPIARTLEFTSPIYRLELAVTGRLFAQSAELYAAIEMENPQGEEIRAIFREAAEAVEAAIKHGDRGRFSAWFAEVSDYMGPFGEEAHLLSDLLIETLVARP